MLVELSVSFVSILAISTIIYLAALKKAPKPRRTSQHISMYACGEKVRVGRLSMNLTFYKYLAYFMIFDSSIIIAAFSSLSFNIETLPFLLTYLCAILVAALLLAEGDT